MGARAPPNPKRGATNLATFDLEKLAKLPHSIKNKIYVFYFFNFLKSRNSLLEARPPHLPAQNYVNYFEISLNQILDYTINYFTFLSDIFQAQLLDQGYVFLINFRNVKFFQFLSNCCFHKKSNFWKSTDGKILAQKLVNKSKILHIKLDQLVREDLVSLKNLFTLGLIFELKVTIDFRQNDVKNVNFFHDEIFGYLEKLLPDSEFTIGVREKNFKRDGLFGGPPFWSSSLAKLGSPVSSQYCQKIPKEANYCEYFLHQRLPIFTKLLFENVKSLDISRVQNLEFSNLLLILNLKNLEAFAHMSDANMVLRHVDRQRPSLFNSTVNPTSASDTSTRAKMARVAGQEDRYQKALKYQNLKEICKYRDSIDSRNTLDHSRRPTNSCSDIESLYAQLVKQGISYPRLKSLVITPFLKNGEHLTQLLSQIFPKVQHLTLLYSEANVENGDFTFGSHRSFKSLKVSFLKTERSNDCNFIIRNFHVSEHFESYAWEKNEVFPAGARSVNSLFGTYPWPSTSSTIPNSSSNLDLKFKMTKYHRLIKSQPVYVNLYQFLDNFDVAKSPRLKNFKLFDTNFWIDGKAKDQVSSQDPKFPQFLKFLASVENLELHKITWLTDADMEQIYNFRVEMAEEFYARERKTQNYALRGYSDQSSSFPQDYHPKNPSKILLKLCQNIEGHRWFTNDFLSRVAKHFPLKNQDIRLEFCYNLKKHLLLAVQPDGFPGMRP